jgi:hypothetical protein
MIVGRLDTAKEMIMARRRLEGILTAGLAFIGLSVTATVAGAAPQSLALVGTEEPVHLVCANGNCSAEFSAFCLQPDRISPKPGTKYWLTEKSKIGVKGVDRNGREIVLAARDALRFQALRGHTAIEISLAPGLKKRMDLAEVTVSLEKNVTLAPEEAPGDDNPLSEDELALVEQSLRPVGTGIVDTNSEGMVAARITNRLVNLLPDYDGDAAGTAKHWNRLMARAQREGLNPMAKRLAQNAYDLCRYYAERVVPGDMRRCMQGQHDRLMKVLNSEYWKAIRTGS